MQTFEKTVEFFSNEGTESDEARAKRHIETKIGRKTLFTKIISSETESASNGSFIKKCIVLYGIEDEKPKPWWKFW